MPPATSQVLSPTCREEIRKYVETLKNQLPYFAIIQDGRRCVPKEIPGTHQEHHDCQGVRTEGYVVVSFPNIDGLCISVPFTVIFSAATVEA